MPVPVLLVHGIWDTSAQMGPLKKRLELGGGRAVHAIDLHPNDGRSSIPELGKAVAEEAEGLALREGSSLIDLVGFSMGALVSRWYVQRGGGKSRVRRYVSIAGPHHGTVNAYALPVAAARDMRPKSALLRDLSADRDPFGSVEVHCVYTPFDLMILPPKSGVLASARSVRAFRVPMHRFMITAPAVLDYVADILDAL